MGLFLQKLIRAPENLYHPYLSYLNYIDKDYDCDRFFPVELFDKNDKFNIIGRRVVNNVNQYIMKVERSISDS